jgi:hypothetical protein
MQTIAVLALLAVGTCEVIPVHRDALVTSPVVLPNRMCAEHGKVAVSTDKPGERMICELQEPLGTHLPRCTCWDEGLLAQKRDDTQSAMQQLELSRQVCGTGDCGGGSTGAPR